MRGSGDAGVGVGRGFICGVSNSEVGCDWSKLRRALLIQLDTLVARNYGKVIGVHRIEGFGGMNYASLIHRSG